MLSSFGIAPFSKHLPFYSNLRPLIVWFVRDILNVLYPLPLTLVLKTQWFLYEPNAVINLNNIIEIFLTLWYVFLCSKISYTSKYKMFIVSCTYNLRAPLLKQLLTRINSFLLVCISIVFVRSWVFVAYNAK